MCFDCFFENNVFGEGDDQGRYDDEKECFAKEMIKDMMMRKSVLEKEMIKDTL